MQIPDPAVLASVPWGDRAAPSLGATVELTLTVAEVATRTITFVPR